MYLITKQELHQLIAENKTLAAIEFLRSASFIQRNFELSRELTVHLASFQSYSEDKRKETSTSEELRVRKNNLHHSLLKIVDLLPNENLELQLPPLPNLPRPKYPFIGLRWFSREDAPIFFGREKEIQKLYNWILSGERLVLLYGQSGVGKSSLLHAGLLPRLEYRWICHYLRWNSGKGVVNSLDGTQINVADKEKVYVIDQLEEIFTSSSSEVKEIFSSIKSTLAKDGNLQIVLSFRKEFLAETQDMLDDLSIDYSSILLKPLRKRELVKAITGVAFDPWLKRRFNLEIQNGLPEKIADHILTDEESHIAPLLQILLRKMWDAVKDNNEDKIFDSNLYSGFQEQSLTSMLSTQIKELEKKFPREVESGLVLDILKFFTTVRATAKKAGESEWRSRYAHIFSIDSLIQELEHLFLLTSLDRGNQATIRLAHDALAPIIIENFNNSDLIGQRAFRLIDSKRIDIASDREVEFSNTDLDTILQGEYGMRKLSDKEIHIINVSSERRNKERKALEILQERDEEFTLALFQIQEEERKRIGRDLHDRVGSMLATIKLLLSSLDNKTGFPNLENRKRFQESMSLLNEANEEVRRLSHNLSSDSALSTVGLVAQLQDMVRVIQESGQLMIELSTFNFDERLDVSTEVKIYRIIQELVSNALKHAKATKLLIQLSRIGGTVEILVEDDGFGFDINSLSYKEGIGLRNIKGRISELSGDIQIESSVGRGTKINIQIPIEG
ncbi:nSTAND1 domain-containing NTPase [Flavilitoribacter nigricans]|uniref:histidine kinase n=1 Tax=Flavilitoribacter nigricans (strain ATCC 23147 / DSM 23189 / NBRC 102662 / NCIMB 1420 / SS-2) TaxID=1122177 RepID=A0A2D0N317_FLAN2|nr:ATP-binding protein [Flavilitoribacter nigricans]PHN02911.1 hypothetical protein CRP01_29325 [Flavilitoribacter nigricans DSM 23189 = NBRC 102662]